MVCTIHSHSYLPLKQITNHVMNIFLFILTLHNSWGWFWRSLYRRNTVRFQIKMEHQKVHNPNNSSRHSQPMVYIYEIASFTSIADSAKKSTKHSTKAKMCDHRQRLPASRVFSRYEMPHVQNGSDEHQVEREDFEDFQNDEGSWRFYEC